MVSKNWENFVDVMNVCWLLVFIIGFLAFDTDIFCFKEKRDQIPSSIVTALKPYCNEKQIIPMPQEIQQLWNLISWIIWLVFVADVVLQYFRNRNFKTFMHSHWFDIILVMVPVLRIARILRVLRLIQFLKITKALKAFKHLFR